MVMRITGSKCASQEHKCKSLRLELSFHSETKARLLGISPDVDLCIFLHACCQPSLELTGPKGGRVAPKGGNKSYEHGLNLSGS